MKAKIVSGIVLLLMLTLTWSYLVSGETVEPLHDVAVLDVTPSQTLVALGESVEISVIIENQGDYPEPVNGAVYADLAPPYGDEVGIGVGPCMLPAGETLTLTVLWETSSSTPLGDYLISAVYFPVPGETDIVDNTYEDGVVSVAISGVVDFHPERLNLEGKGEWFTAYIELPEGYDVANIELATVFLVHNEFELPAVKDPKYDFVTDPALFLTDHDEDGILERMVKFDRTELTSYLATADLGEPVPPDEDSAAYKLFRIKPKVKAKVDPPKVEAWCSLIPYLEVWEPAGEVVKPKD